MRRTSVMVLLLATLSLAPASAENVWVASNTIRIIDMDQGAVVASLTVAEEQVVTEIAFDGSRAFVASMGGLFEVDADSMAIVRQISPRPTCSVSLAPTAGRLAAIHLQPAGEGLADRDRGIPTTVTLALYDLASLDPLASTEVYGHPLRARIAPDGQRIYVLDSQESTVAVYDGSVALVGVIDAVPDAEEGQVYLCSDLGLSPDGQRLSVVRNSSVNTALVLITPADPLAASVVRVEDLGHDHRARNAAWTTDGGAVLVTAIGWLGRFETAAPTVAWRDVGHQFALVAAAPGGEHIVMATPTFDAERGTGGVLIADADGNPLRVVELPDISPYTIAVQP